MAKQAKVAAKLTLDNVQFVRSIKESIKYAKDLAKQFKAQPIKTTFLAGALAARKGIQATASAVQGLARVAVTAFKVASVAATAFAVGIAGISVKAIEAASQMETIETSFKVFLGSAQAAKDRMKELSDFAAHTPFQLPQVAEASKILQVLTKGALATGKGLELVGDIASGTNKEFAETAQTVGKLFAALRSGTHPGQALESLQETGAISPEARRKIEGMAGIDGAKAWKLAQQELSRFSGMMQQQSQTWNGLMSTFHDSVRMALAAFGAPLIKDLKPTLDEITTVIFALTPKITEAGKAFAEGIKTGVGVMEEAFFDPSKLIEPLKLGLKAAFLEGSNVLIAGIRTAASLIPDLFGTFLGAFNGISQIISGELMKGFAEPIAWFAASIEQAMDKMNETLHPDPNRLAAAASARQHEQDLRRAAASGDFAEVARQGMLVKKYRDQSEGPSLEERKRSYTNKDDIAARGQDEVDKGEAALANTSKQAMKAIAKAVDAFKVNDVTNAGDAMKDFLAAIQKLGKKGQQDTQNAINEMDKGKDNSQRFLASLRDKPKASPFALRGGSLGDSGGLRGASNAASGANPFTSGFFGAQGKSGFIGPRIDGSLGLNATGPLGQGSMLAGGARRTVNSLLPLQERRKAAQAVRAAAMGENFLRTGRWETGGKLGVVGSGDRKAAADYVKDKQREKLGLDKTNEILHGLETKFDTMIGLWQGNGG